MFCPKCGVEAQANANFCAKCGGTLDRSALASVSAITTQKPGPSTVMKALKASLIPAGIGAAIGISAAMKASGSLFIGKFIMGLLTAAMVGTIFGLVAFIFVYGYLKLRGK